MWKQNEIIFASCKTRTLREVTIIIIIIVTSSVAIILVLTAAPDSVVGIVTDCELGDRRLESGQGTVFFSLLLIFLTDCAADPASYAMDAGNCLAGVKGAGG